MSATFRESPITKVEHNRIYLLDTHAIADASTTRIKLENREGVSETFNFQLLKFKVSTGRMNERTQVWEPIY